VSCGRCADTKDVCGEHPRFPAAVTVPGHQKHGGEAVRCPACCPVAFGAAISEDRKHGSIVAAGRQASGRLLVDLSPFYDHRRLLVARMVVLYGRHEPVVVVVNPKSQSATLVKPLADAGIVVTPMTAADVAVAHGEFLDLVDGGGMEHLDQKPLTDAVRAAKDRPLAGGKAWEPRVAAVDQGPLVAATGAVWGFLRWEESSSPGVWAI